MSVFSMECGHGEISKPVQRNRDIIDTIDLYTFDQSYSTLSTTSPKFFGPCEEFSSDISYRFIQ